MERCDFHNMSAIAPADASAPSRWNQIRNSVRYKLVRISQKLIQICQQTTLSWIIYSFRFAHVIT